MPVEMLPFNLRLGIILVLISRKSGSFGVYIKHLVASAAPACSSEASPSAYQHFENFNNFLHICRLNFALGIHNILLSSVATAFNSWSPVV